MSLPSLVSLRPPLSLFLSPWLFPLAFRCARQDSWKKWMDHFVLLLDPSFFFSAHRQRVNRTPRRILPAFRRHFVNVRQGTSTTSSEYKWLVARAIANDDSRACSSILYPRANATTPHCVATSKITRVHSRARRCYLRKVMIKCSEGQVDQSNPG